MVFEATYLVAALTPGHSSARCGQYGAQISKVLRPNNRSNGMFICLFMTVPRTSSEYGTIHPPYAKPPLVSSSGLPGDCMTPSREEKESKITFLMAEVLQNMANFGADHVCSSVFPFFSLPLAFGMTDGERRFSCKLHVYQFYWQSKKKTSPILLKSSARLLPGKDQPTRLTWLDESLAWVLTEVALLRMYHMSIQQPAGFRHFTEVCEVASHVSRRFPPIHLKNRRTFTLFTSRVLYCQKHPSFACTWPGCQPHEPGYLSNHK